MDNQSIIFRNRITEAGFARAFKGDWGSEAHTKKPGVLQDLSRLSFFSTTAQLRKTNTPITADGAKIVVHVYLIVHNGEFYALFIHPMVEISVYISIFLYLQILPKEYPDIHLLSILDKKGLTCNY